MKKIAYSKINDLYGEIASICNLYLPVRKAGELNFGKYEVGAEVDIQTLQTVKSPKDFFFPQSEDMMTFKTEGKSIEIADARVKVDTFVLFGVRACDLKSFEVLDKVFLAEPVDTMYQNKRENGIIFTLSCNNPHSSCFCKNFNIDPSNPLGDVECHLVGEYLFLDVKSHRRLKSRFRKLLVPQFLQGRRYRQYQVNSLIKSLIM